VDHLAAGAAPKSHPSFSGPQWAELVLIHGAVRRAKRVAHIEKRLFLLPSLHLHDPNHVASIRSSMYVALCYGRRSMHITLDNKGPSTRLIGASPQHLGNNYAHARRSASGLHPFRRISATGSQLSVCRTIESWWRTIMATTLTL
jgi:hypothetical protein